MPQTTPGSDPVYKRLYACPEMVEDLLRSLFPAETLDAVDWPSLDKLPADYVSDDFFQRHGDAAWRAGLRPGDGRGAWLCVVVLLEFQSTTDAVMALRVLQYTAMLYQELLRAGAATPGRLPPVLPVVLYNGDSAWRAATDVRELVAEAGPHLAPYQPSQRHMVLDERHAAADDRRLQRLTRAVVLLEQSRSPEHLARATSLLRDWLRTAAPEPRIEELKRAFAEWLWVLYRRSEQGDDGPPPKPPPELTLEDVTMTLEERVISWRWIQQGVEQGLRQGVEQEMQRGLERERGLLRHLAEVRFGADTAERLFGLLARENDPQRLAAVGEAIVRCETGDDLLRRAFPNTRLNDVSDR